MEMKEIWVCSQLSYFFVPLQVLVCPPNWENNAILPATNLVKIKSATCQQTAHLLFVESCADSSADRKKIFNFISAFSLASFPVTLMTRESQ